MPISVDIELPRCFGLDAKVGKHRIRQLRHRNREYRGSADLAHGRRGAVALRFPDAGSDVWITNRASYAPAEVRDALLTRTMLKESSEQVVLSASDLRWLRPAADRRFDSSRLAERRAEVLRDWEDKFRYVTADDTRPGLRPPQAGALHAVLAHWTVSDDTATVVMPTGTGKTETMMAVLASERIVPLLVVVPSRQLRDQISDKFLGLGVLPTAGVLPEAVSLPLVATLEGSIQEADQADALLASCNVIVATMQAITLCPPAIRQRLAETVSHLFIDEAHHVAARTWAEFRDAFSPRRVVQFTATPFRGDNKLLPGKVVYRYPLRKAQEEGYFRGITFRSVREFDLGLADVAIARSALEQLDRDLAEGLDHILMARAATISRAEQLHRLYEQLADKRAVVVHSRQSAADRREGLEQIASRAARIVICVDMLGEGYDLPALKIAALHDTHRGLGITFQFIGRFTRSATAIGDATVVANIADPRVEESLAELYSQDADWNVLLRELNEGVVGRQLRRAEFLQGFVDPMIEVPLQNVYPKMSTVAYRVPSGRWRPSNVAEAIPTENLLGLTVNDAENVVVAVTQHREKIAWGAIASLQNVLYDLLLLHYDKSLGLLFIHSSDTRRLHFELAEAVGGDGVELIREMDVFRILSGINRLVVANLGLRHALNRSVRYTMYAGANVHEGLTEATFQNKTTANLFGFGFEDGERASAGCSYKGRLWSYRISDDIGEWVEWCHHIGAKLIDNSINPSEILRTTMTMEAVTERPLGLIPLSIEWSENVWLRNEEAVEFHFEDESATLLDVGIELTTRDEDGPLGFRVFTDTAASFFEIQLSADGVAYAPTDGPNVDVRVGQTFVPLDRWFEEEPPIIRFHNGQQLVRELLFSAPTVDRPFPDDRIDTWDWSDIDLRRESQGPDRDPRSIQRRVIDQLLREDFDIVFNDDDTNEAADVIAIKVDQTTERLRVLLLHCKYASGGTIGHKVADLYEVCGQAQRSVHWKGDRGRLLDHMARRDARWARFGRTRFETGNQAVLAEITRRQRFLEPHFEIVIVQPGLSKRELTDSQRDLLAATQLYLHETFAVPLRIIASA